MSALGAFPFDTIAERGSIHDTDVAQLRRLVHADGVISPDEAELLVALDRACHLQAPEWREAFAEAMTDFLVRQAEPEGYITAENAEWLISRLAPDGRLAHRRDLDLLTELMDRARFAPQTLIAFGLDQVRLALADAAGDGACAAIGDEDVELVRRMIYAFGGDGNIAVTRSEAALLCDINDSLDPASVNDAWTELYVKAMANMLLANAGYAVPSREEALRAEVWLEERGALSPVEMIQSVARLGLDGIVSAYRRQTREECTLARLDRQYRQLVTGEVVDEDEAGWLVDRLTRDGELTPAEAALLDYLRQNAVELDPAFEACLEARLAA